MTASTFAAIFLAAFAVSTFLRLWLAKRQVRHVRAHRDEVPASFAESIPLSAHRKAADYTVAKTRLGSLDIVLGAAALALLTFGGLLQGFSDRLAVLADPGTIAHGTALMVSVAVFLWLLELPLDLYRTFSIEARFGFNRMTWKLYLSDLVKHALIGALLGIPLVVLVLWLMRAMGSLWWLYVWAVWTAFNLLVLFVYPRFIAPLFNRFSPLEDGSMRVRIERLLERCGFKARGLYVMDGSKRSNHGNAYFTGFGSGKRIVLFDTLLSRLAPAEVEAVLAHELGHFKRRHIWKRIAVMFAASLALLGVLGQLIDRPWFYEGLGVHTPSHAAALLLFFAVVPVFLFLFQPVGSLYSRKHEYEADAYASAQTNAADLARALVKLYQDNAATLTPDPLHSAFYDSHPPAAMRIERLSTYH